MVAVVVGCRLIFSFKVFSRGTQLFSFMSTAYQHRLTSAKRYI